MLCAIGQKNCDSIPIALVQVLANHVIRVAESFIQPGPASMTEPSRLEFEQYRVWLKLLAQAGLNQALQAKVDASDIAQETLIRAHGKLPALVRTRGELRAWLRKTLTNVLKDEVRKYTAQKRDVALELGIEARVDETAFALELALASSRLPPEEDAALREASGKALAALRQLPELERQAIELKHIRGRTLRQIAAEMGKTEPAVAGLLRRGLQALRSRLDPKE